MILGEHKINYLIKTLAVSPSMLGAVLGVTERTLEGWKNKPEAELKELPKAWGLLNLYKFVSSAKRVGVETGTILNLLMEPIEKNNEDPTSMLRELRNTSPKEAPGLIFDFLEKLVRVLK